MAANVEKFVVDLGFNASDLKKLKELLKLQQTANNPNNPSKPTSNSNMRKERELNAITNKRLQLTKLIARADKEGVNTSKYKGAVHSAQKITNLEKLRLELEELTFKAKEANQKRVQAAKQKELNTEKKITQEKVKQASPYMADTPETMRRRETYAGRVELRATKAGADEKSIEAFKDKARAAYGNRAAMDELSLALDRYSYKQRQATMRTRKANIAMQGLNDSTRHMIRSYASLYAAVESTSFIIRTGQDFERMEAGMLAASDTAQIAEENLEFLRKESIRLGFDLAAASKAFVKLSASASGKASIEEIREMFVGVTEASTVFQLSMDDTVGTIRAMQQMFAKGQIMRDEFKNQLGDRLPIALRALELSTGKTSEQLLKMMEAGELGVEYIPKFAKALGQLARENGALERSMEASGKVQDRFLNTLKIASNQVYTGDMEESYVSLLKSLTEFLNTNEDMMKGLGRIFAFVINTIKTVSSVVLPILDAMVYTLGEVSNIFNKVFYGDAETRIIAMGTATWALVTAAKALNNALTIQIAKRAALLALNPVGIAAIGGALVAEDTIKGVKDPESNTAFNASGMGTAYRLLTTPVDKMGGFFEREAAKINQNITIDIKAEDGFWGQVADVVNTNNSSAKVEAY